MATSSAVGPNRQIFNSYGSRTNKFLLIWYGFSYRNNLYDSVTLRLQVQFTKELRKAKDVILDTYVGGQGRAFRKNDGEWVK
jgi:hemolysin activation/secretion protein